MDRITLVLMTIMASCIAIVCAGVKVPIYRQMSPQYSDYDDDDLTFSGDVSSGSGHEETSDYGVEQKHECKGENAAECQKKHFSTALPIYRNYGTKSHVITRKPVIGRVTATPFRSLIFGPVRSTTSAMTSSYSPNRDLESPYLSATDQSPCAKSLSRDCSDVVHEGGSNGDNDIELIEDPDVVNETNPVDGTERHELVDDVTPGSTHRVVTSTMSFSTTTINHWTKTTSSGSAATDATSYRDDLKSRLIDETPKQRPNSDVIEAQRHTTTMTSTSRFRYSNSLPALDGAVVPLTSDDRYAALALNVTLLVGIAFLVVVFAVILVCLILYRNRKTRCDITDTVISRPVTCHSSSVGVTSPLAGALAAHRSVDVRKPPSYQLHAADDTSDMDACWNNGSGSRAKVGDPKEWFV